jgi:hypothetical protein
MEFGFWDTVFLITLTIFFLYKDLKRRFHSKENEIDKVLAEAEQVRYKSVDSMVREVMFCKSEIVEGQIFVYEKETNVFITQQPNVESMFKYFINNYPHRRIQFGE